MRTLAGILLVTGCLWIAAASAEEFSVPVEYRGEQIQLIGRFERGAVQGPLTIVILLHNCAGVDGSRSLAVWAPLRGRKDTPPCGSIASQRAAITMCAAIPGQVRPSERTQDVLAAAYLLAARPDVRTDKIAVLGLSHGGSTAVYVARDHEELHPLRERLAARRGKLVASVALYGGCGQNLGSPVIFPLLALLGGRDDWTPAAPCVALASAQTSGMMQAVVYPDAYHSFDAASGNEKPHSAYGHLLAYDATATADVHKRVPEFLYRYLH